MIDNTDSSEPSKQDWEEADKWSPGSLKVNPQLTAMVLFLFLLYGGFLLLCLLYLALTG